MCMYCGLHDVQESACALLKQWEPLVLQWPVLGAAARQDLMSRLASSELMFFMALKDRAVYEEVRWGALVANGVGWNLVANRVGWNLECNLFVL